MLKTTASREVHGRERLASGGSTIITKIPFSDDVFMKATSVLTGAVDRSINEMNLNVQNGVSAPVGVSLRPKHLRL